MVRRTTFDRLLVARDYVDHAREAGGASARLRFMRARRWGFSVTGPVPARWPVYQWTVHLGPLLIRRTAVWGPKG